MLLYIFIDYSKVQIKIFFEWIRYEWSTLKTTDEINILRKYADFFKLLMVIMTGKKLLN